MNPGGIFFILIGLILVVKPAVGAGILEGKFKYGLLSKAYQNYSDDDKLKLRNTLLILSRILGVIFAFLGWNMFGWN